MIYRKSQHDIDMMRQAGRVLALALNVVRARVRPGVRTRDLDALAEQVVRDHGHIPTFKGIYGDPNRGIPAFPATLCISVNEEVVHGIPGERELRDGDIVSIDGGVTVRDGSRSFVADAAFTMPVGEVRPEALALIEITERALEVGVEQARVGNRLNDIGAAIEELVAPRGHGIVREYFGHGVGYRLHEDPMVPNFGQSGTGPRIKHGWCLAIEPMINLGTERVRTRDDRWTVVTADGAWSAHFEHTMAITEEGTEVLTRQDLPEVQP